MRKLVTTALIYANGDIHIGHVRSTYLPADVYCRFNRRLGHDLIFISGTDEYGTPISIQAEKAKVQPIVITNKYYQKDIDEFNRLGISFDNFDRTTRPGHAQTTTEIFRKLYNEGLIYEKTMRLPYCPKCGRFLPDRYVRGTCPYCKFEDARGDECDSCGRALADGELLNPVCHICRTPAVLKETRHWFFKLSAFQKWLKEWISSDDLTLPSVGKQFLIGQYLSQELLDVAITRDLDWGIPVPLPEASGKVLYVWFDAPIGYIDSTKQWAERQGDPDLWKTYWLDPSTEIIHFIGKGILYHHALFWPSMLKGAGWKPPTVIPAYGYATLEGFKLSKERNWMVKLSDFLDRYNPDSLRYYWLSISPLKEDADFSWDEFARKHNNELTDTLGNFVHRVLTFTASNFQKAVPNLGKKAKKAQAATSFTESLDKESKELLGLIDPTFKKVEESINSFEIRNGLLEIINLARQGNKYFNDRQPWKPPANSPSHAAETIYTSLQLVKALALLIEPYLPFTADAIWKQLGVDSDIHQVPWAILQETLPQGHTIGTPTPLFQKIESNTVKEEKQRLRSATEASNPTAKKETTTLEPVSIDEFRKVKLVTGKIVQAEPIEGSKKLLKLMIDLGEPTPRQVVAGLAAFYTPESLVGKTVIVVANLKPAKLFNTASNGMVLASEHDGVVSLLKPDRDLPPGSPIL